ncbi:hypothetical protein MG293_003710 [Ovis ammon polii]|uniref:Uncharacterized protein n=1 Tax=Ovis ammon polii TaxID=230172 RepID=A0AAD4UN88_OVIAM|nr:hypothetical protein MG293_003710 [Ovis ammon polii]
MRHYQARAADCARPSEAPTHYGSEPKGCQAKCSFGYLYYTWNNSNLFAIVSSVISRSEKLAIQKNWFSMSKTKILFNFDNIEICILEILGAVQNTQRSNFIQDYALKNQDVMICIISNGLCQWTSSFMFSLLHPPNEICGE